jgi:hypothetical protein
VIHPGAGQPHLEPGSLLVRRGFIITYLCGIASGTSFQATPIAHQHPPAGPRRSPRDYQTVRVKSMHDLGGPEFTQSSFAHNLPVTLRAYHS